MRKTATWNRLLATTVISGLATFAATPAFAQGTTPEPEIRQSTPENTLSGDDPDVTDTAPETTGSSGTTITITGSRIARPDLTSSSPVTIIDSEQVALTGTVTLETLLNDLPQVIPGNNRTSNNAGGEPFATLDLRGLGTESTLILLDGERLPPASTSGTVDISQIPVGLIERIDVVTGGASAVYGSDAMAGVVNFILKQDFEGLELTGQTGIAGEGVGFNFSVAGLFGGNFADDRGNVTVYASYFDREGVGQGRYDYSRVSGAIFLSPDNQLYVVSDPSNIIPGSVPAFAGGSAAGPSGQVANNSSNPFRNLSVLLPGQFSSANTDCNTATPGVVVNTGNLSFNDGGRLTPFFTSGQCNIPLRNTGSSRYNFAPDNLLTIPYDRFNLSTIARYEFSDRTRGRMFASYVNTNSEVNLAPTPAQAGTAFTVDPTRAQFIPADLRTALNSRTFFTRAGSPIRFGSSASCLNANPVPVCTENSGANELFTFSRRFNETGPRIGLAETQSIVLRGSVEHELGDGWMISAGGGWGRTDLIEVNRGNINRLAVEQGINGCKNLAGGVGGPGVLPGCVPVNIFGVNSITPTQVAFIQTDTTDISEFEQTRASVNITGNLFELPGGPMGIAIGAEVRHDVGSFVPDDAKRRGEIIGFNAANPQAGEITVKEVYGEVRLPLLGGSGGFPDLLAVELGARYSDYSTIGSLFNYKAAIEFAPIPWVRFRGAYNRAGRAPNIFELFQAGDQGFPGYTDPCNFNNPSRNVAFCVAQGVPLGDVATFLQANTQVQAFAFGQPDLEPERAETYTAGVVVTPSRFPLGRLSLTADYYDITISSQISTLGAGFYINRCYQLQDLDACSRVFRNPATGQIDSVNTGRTNSAVPTRTRGIDATLNWVIPLADLFGGSLGGGRIRISEIFNHVLEYDAQGSDVVGRIAVGVGAPVSEWNSTLTLGYEEDVFTGQVRWVYKSGANQDDYFGPSFGVDRTQDLSYFDLSLRWQVSDRFEFTGIVNNILDQRPEQTISGIFEQSNTNASFLSPIILGRSFSMQARLRF